MLFLGLAGIVLFFVGLWASGGIRRDPVDGPGQRCGSRGPKRERCCRRVQHSGSHRSSGWKAKRW